MIRFMREQGMATIPNPRNPRVFNNPNLPMGGDKAMLLLGQHPPLPGNAAVRLVHTEEENHEPALVPSYPYYEESPEERQQDTYQSIPATTSSNQELEASYQMDHNTLMFIAQGGMGKPMPNQGPKLLRWQSQDLATNVVETIGLGIVQIRRIECQAYHQLEGFVWIVESSI